MSYNYNGVGAKSQISKYLALKTVCGGIPPHISSSRRLPIYRNWKINKRCHANVIKRFEV